MGRQPGVRATRLQIAIALTVAVSAGLVALWAGGTVTAVALASAAGLAVGAALAAYLSWIVPESGLAGRRRRRRR